jgi:hypothetical protein
MRAAPIKLDADSIVGWRDDAARRRDIGRAFTITGSRVSIKVPALTLGTNEIAQWKSQKSEARDARQAKRNQHVEKANSNVAQLT